MSVRALLAVAGLLAVTLHPVRGGPDNPQSRSMMPHGIITADMFKNNRQNAARKLALPPAVQVSSAILNVRQPTQAAEEGRRAGRNVKIDLDNVPVIEGVRVPDDPKEKNIIYRNARIINNVLVTDQDSGPDISHTVSQSVAFDKNRPSSPLASAAINSLSSLAKLVISTSVKTFAQSEKEAKGYNNVDRPDAGSPIIGFRTPPPLPWQRNHYPESSGRSFPSNFVRSPIISFSQPSYNLVREPYSRSLHHTYFQPYSTFNHRSFAPRSGSMPTRHSNNWMDVPKSKKKNATKKWLPLSESTMFTKPHKYNNAPVFRVRPSTWSAVNSNVRPSKTVPHQYSSHSLSLIREKPSFRVDDESTGDIFHAGRG